MLILQWLVEVKEIFYLFMTFNFTTTSEPFRCNFVTEVNLINFKHRKQNMEPISLLSYEE